MPLVFNATRKLDFGGITKQNTYQSKKINKINMEERVYEVCKGWSVAGGEHLQ